MAQAQGRKATVAAGAVIGPRADGRWGHRHRRPTAARTWRTPCLVIVSTPTCNKGVVWTRFNRLPGRRGQSVSDHLRRSRARHVMVAEDRGFEPLRAFTQHAFQACALGHYANPPSQRLSPAAGPPKSTALRISVDGRPSVHVCSAQPLVWRHLAQLPQGRKAARVSELCRVHEGSLAARSRLAVRQAVCHSPIVVAFGVVEVRRPSHVGRPASARPAQSLPPAADRLERRVDVVDGDRDDRVLGVGCSVRLTIPPLIAPGSVGSPCSSISVVITIVYCISGMSGSASRMPRCRRSVPASTSSAGISKWTTLLHHGLRPPVRVES